MPPKGFYETVLQLRTCYRPGIGRPVSHEDIIFIGCNKYLIG